MRPLEGTLVVSLEQAVAAPMASRRLAEAGARVIKLERPEGDFARGYDDVVEGQSSYFVWLNRGKESVTVDLRRAEDRELFEALIAKADVFIQNLKPGSLERLGYPLAGMREQRPELITCSISGYGEQGLFAERKAYDLLIQAESGMASVTGGPDEPSRIGVSVVDVGTGMNAYEAILEALILRSRTGIGSTIALSMFDSMAEWMAVPLLHGRYGTAPKRIGLRHPSVAPYGVFQCGDGTPILIAIQNDREWRTFATVVMDEPGLGEDPDYARNIDRVRNRAATDALVAERFRTLPKADLVQRLTEGEIAFGMVNEVAGVLSHPCLREIEVVTPSGTAVMPASAALFEGAGRSPGAVPAVGAHTQAVRREFLGPR